MSGNKSINIVIVNDFDYIEGGASKIAISTANMLADAGFHVIFFSGTDSDHCDLNENVTKVTAGQIEAIKRKNKIAGALSNIYNFKSKKAFKKLLKELDRKDTVIHFHGWTKILSSSVFDAAFGMGFRTILTAHECFSACPNGVFYDFRKDEICPYRGLSAKCLFCNCDYRSYPYKVLRFIRMFVQRKIVRLNKRIDRVLTVSDMNESIIRPYFDERVSFVRLNNPSEYIREEKISKKEDHYLYVGRTEKSKGILDFCEAISRLKLKGLVIGSGELLDHCMEHYSDSDIRFIGWQDKDVINEELRKAKALIYPSLAYESFGLSILDSLFLGTPVICSDVCGGKDLIKDGVNGYVYKDLADLLEKISLLESGKLQYREAREEDFAPYSRDHYEKRLIAQYYDVLKMRS